MSFVGFRVLRVQGLRLLLEGGLRVWGLKV